MGNRIYRYLPLTHLSVVFSGEPLNLSEVRLGVLLEEAQTTTNVAGVVVVVDGGGVVSTLTVILTSKGLLKNYSNVGVQGGRRDIQAAQILDFSIGGVAASNPSSFSSSFQLISRRIEKRVT